MPVVPNRSGSSVGGQRPASARTIEKVAALSPIPYNNIIRSGGRCPSRFFSDEAFMNGCGVNTRCMPFPTQQWPPNDRKCVTGNARDNCAGAARLPTALPLRIDDPPTRIRRTSGAYQKICSDGPITWPSGGMTYCARPKNK